MTFLALILSAVAQDPSVPAWGSNEVDAYITENNPAELRAIDDPFTVPRLSPPPAPRVVISAPLGRQFHTGDQTIDATWSYDAESQRLTLVAEPENSVLMHLDIPGSNPADILRRPRPHQVWRTFSRVDRSDGGTASNAYGATVQVTNVRTEERGIAQLSSEVDNVGPAFSERYGRRYEHSFTIAPEEARALTATLAWEIEAVTRPYAPGKWVVCGLGGFSATIRTPINATDRGCYLTTEVVAVRFVNTTSGEIVREWRARGR